MPGSQRERLQIFAWQTKRKATNLFLADKEKGYKSLPGRQRERLQIFAWLTKRKVTNLCLADKEKGYKSLPGRERERLQILAWQSKRHRKCNTIGTYICIQMSKKERQRIEKLLQY